MKTLTISTRTRSPIYNLFVIDYVTLDVSIVKRDIKKCDYTVYPNPKLSKLLKLIFKYECMNTCITKDDIYITNVDTFIEVFTMSDNAHTNEMLNSSNIVYAFGVDKDESHAYFVTST